MNVEHGLATFLKLMTCRELKLLAVASRPARKQLRLLNTFLKDLIKVLHCNLRTLDNKYRFSGQKSASEQQCITRGVMCAD